MVKEITPIRIILMLMIFVHHINYTYNGGYPAVAAFFMLSGFVMTLGYYSKVDSPNFSYSSYLLKRMVRIYPMHWLCIIAFVIAAILVGPPIESSMKAMALNVLLLQSWIPDMDVYFSLNAASWYCSSLLFFIVVFPPFLRFIKGGTIKGLFLLFSMLVGLYLVLWIFSPTIWRHPIMYINPVMRLIDSFLGVGLAMLVMKVARDETLMLYLKKNRALLQVIVLISIVAFVALSILLQGKWKEISLFYWIPMAVILFSITILNYSKTPNILSRVALSAPLQWLGRCSFSFYMLHAIVIRYARPYVETHIPHGHNVYLCAFVLFLMALSFAQISYNLIEVKLTDQLNNMITKIQY